MLKLSSLLLPIVTVQKSARTTLLNAELTWANKIFLNDFGFPMVQMPHMLEIFCHELLLFQERVCERLPKFVLFL